MTARGSASRPPAAPGLVAAATRALALVEDGTIIGLGSGRAAFAFIDALGARVRAGTLSVRAVPSSEVSRQIAESYGIPVVGIDEDAVLGLTVDGADEITPDLDLVKGRGGALVRERIIAAASARQIILAGPEKLVRHLGERGPIPVEVIPLAAGFAARRLRGLGLAPALRRVKSAPNAADPAAADLFVTDNGNLTLDCVPARPCADGPAARTLEAAILAIPGVVDTGLFLGTAERALIGHDDGHVDVLMALGAPS